jgi:hypothetical protein
MLTRARRRALVALVPLAVLPLLVAATHGSKRHAVTVSCGQTITSSTTLSADLVCNADGVIIGADHVTLNLNGHRIRAFGSATGVSSSHVGAVVENGSVVGFNNDVSLSGDSSRVVNVQAGNAQAFGILVTGENDVISGNRAFGNGSSGIAGFGTGSQYTNNFLQSNAGYGLQLDDASLVSGNKALSNSVDGIAAGNGSGESLSITNNLANGNHLNGIDAGGGGDPTAITLSGNQAFFNSLVGIGAAAGVNDGGHNKANGNGTLAQCTDIVCS